jgi:RNA polymerase sigma-70 factor (ECF subfamily)
VTAPAGGAALTPMVQPKSKRFGASASRRSVERSAQSPEHAPQLSAAMERYAGGDPRAFALIHDELSPRLRRILSRRGCNDVLADDLIQQTFLRLHVAREQFRPDSELTPWAASIATRLAIDSWRKLARETLDPTSFAASIRLDPEEQLIAAELERALRTAVAKLPNGQREAFELVKLHGWSLARAAEHSGTSVVAIKLRVHRAVEALRAIVAAFDEA